MWQAIYGPQHSCKDLAMCSELLVAHEVSSCGELLVPVLWPMTLVVSLMVSYIWPMMLAISPSMNPLGLLNTANLKGTTVTTSFGSNLMNSSQLKTCGASTNPSRCGEQSPYISKDLELHREPLLHQVSDSAEPIAQHTSNECYIP